MADDYDDDDPLRSSGSTGQASDSEPAEQESKDDTQPVPGAARRAELYKYPSGEPGIGYYEEQRQKSYLEAQKSQEQFLKDITPYRDHILELLKQPAVQQPQMAGAGSNLDPTKMQAILATSSPYLAIGSKHLRDIFGAIVGGHMAPFRAWTLKGKEEERLAAHEAERWVRDYNENQINQYKEVLNNRHLEIDESMKVMKLIAQQHQDVMMLDSINRKDLPGIISQLDKHERVEQKRRDAVDNWDIDQQKKWLGDAGNRRYATIVSNMTDGKIDLTKVGAEEFRKNLKAADKTYPYSRFLQDTKSKQPEAQPGEKPPAQYEDQRQAEQQKKQQETDPMNLRKPATDEEKKAFQDKINSYLPHSDTERSSEPSDTDRSSTNKKDKEDKRKSDESSDDDHPLGPSQSEENLKRQQSQNWGINIPNLPLGPSPAQQSPDPLVANPLQYGQ